MIDQGTNEQFLNMDLLMRILKLKAELRPSIEKVLNHPLFWEDKRSLKFIFEIQKNIDVLDPKFANNIGNWKEYQKLLWKTPIVQQLKVALDLEKSVVNNGWKAKLDASLAEEFNRGYEKESVTDLLRAMRNQVIIPLKSLTVFPY